MKEDLITLISAYHNAGIGIINDVDLDNEKITVILDNKNEVECDLFFPYCHIYNKDKTAWGHISYPSKGDFAIIGMYKGQPTILQWINGKENIEDVYENGKLKINRIKDSEDTDTVLDEKMKIGEILLRSIGLGDLFFDKFGNIILDTEKEFIMRFGNRDSDYKISSPETQLRIGKVKDINGVEKVDGDNKKIKLEVIYNTGNALILNEEGKWHIKNNNADIIINASGEIELDNGNSSVVLQTDGKVIIENANTKITIKANGDIELGEEAVEKLVLGNAFMTLFNSHTHATAGVGPPSTPLPLMIEATHLSGKNKTK
jgi:hypothetical protein